MSLSFTKHHGLGNDFLVALDATSDEAAALGPDDARRWCDRHTGIGADGLIRGAVPHTPGLDLDVVMHLWNADGSRAEMSGNGIRCLAHAVLLARAEREAHLRIGTDGGVRQVHACLDSPTGASVRVDMGPVTPGPAIPAAVLEHFDGARMASLDVGNPHLVVEVPDPSVVDLDRDGAWAETQFPEGVNVEFIAPSDEPDSLDLVVWERGAGVTMACGTGATAAAAAAHGWGLVGRLVEVHMPGGAAQVEVGANGVLIGPSVLIARIDPAVEGAVVGAVASGGTR